MPEHPNELPEGAGSGGGRVVFRPRGEFPAELPAARPGISNTAMLQELLNVRSRLHALENAQLVQRVTGTAAGAAFIPNEIPEGEGGWGGEIAEIVGPFHPGEQPAEIPVDRLAALEAQVTSLADTLSQISQQLGKQAGGA